MNYINNKKTIIFGGAIIIFLALFFSIKFIPKYFSTRLQTATIYTTPAVSNFIWVVNTDSNSVNKIDKTTNTIVATIPVGYYPFGVSVDLDSVWVGVAGEGKLYRIDKNTNSILAQIVLPFNPYIVAVDENFVWVTSDSFATLSKIDKNTNTVVATISIDASPYGVVVDQDYVWVASLGPDVITKIDKNTDTIITTISVKDDPEVAYNPWSVASDGNFIWVTNSATTTVTKINRTTNAIVAEIQVGITPYALSVDEDWVWVANSGSNTVSKIDKNTNIVVDTISVSNAYGISVDQDYVWVTSNTLDSVSKIDKITNTIIETIDVGAGPTSFGDMTGFRYDLLFGTPVSSPSPSSSPVTQGRRRAAQIRLSEGVGGSIETDNLAISAGTDNTTEEEPSIQVSTTSSTPTIVEVTSTAKLTEVFTRNLGLGSVGEDVKLLQIYLNNHNFMVSSIGLGSSGNETTFYGEKTKAAVKLYQEYYKDEILIPLGLQEGTGFFGTTTRNYLNSKY